MIAVESVIVWPAPNARGTEKSHGGPLGADEVAAPSACSDFSGTGPSTSPTTCSATRVRALSGVGRRADRNVQFDKWRAGNPRAVRRPRSRRPGGKGDRGA
ncbi:hypothetical protein [Streptomyces sp. NPDC058625]|uniref:hypothetical protein n=1 Tax=Streptomyces sp. NPDC058625 TaxID=3346564 RepID=UPI00364B7446